MKGDCKKAGMKHEVEMLSLYHLRLPNCPYTSILRAFRNNEDVELVSARP